MNTCNCTNTHTCPQHTTTPVNDFPPVDDLLGADPDWIGGMDVDEFIDMQRRKRSES